MPKQSMGTRFQIGANYIAGLTSVNGLELSADTIETTTLESNGWREFAQGLKDGGEVSIQGFFEPGDTNGQVALKGLFDSGALTAFTINFPAALGAQWSFNGIVTGVSTGAEMEDLVSFEATIKVSGQPALGLTASGGLTALSLAGTGGTLSPAFANTTYYYSFGGVSAASVTVTATAANHTLLLFIDGVYSATLTSGSASAAITLTLNVGKKLTIVAYEAAKTQKIYEIIAIKTA